MGSFSIWHWLIVFGLALIIVPSVFYLIALQKALEAIDPAMRPVTPGLVWLQLIPIFNLVWLFILVNHLKKGYAKMSAAGRLRSETTAGFGVGIAMACLSVACAIPGVATVAVIPAMVCWVLHWIQVNEARKLVIPAS